MIVLVAAFLGICLTPPLEAAGVKVLPGLAYKSGERVTDYEKERCKLDLYLPVGKKAFPTLVWFHGGGLQGGNRDGKDTVAVAHSLAETGVAVASVGYRLSPKAKYPAYIEDAAAAFAWTRAHVAEHGGNPEVIFIGGHSAGGYLTFLVGMDPRYLREYGVALSAIAGLIPVSGQTMDHYTVRGERGGGRFTITAGEAAPVFHIGNDTPPMLVLYADHDMAARQAENEYFVEVMKDAGNKRVTGKLIRDRTHGTIASRIAQDGDPARQAILEFIETESKAKK